MQLLSKNVTYYVKKLFCTEFVKIFIEYIKILKNIHRSAVIFNTNDYPLFLFEDILQVCVKKKKIFIKVI